MRRGFCFWCVEGRGGDGVQGVEVFVVEAERETGGTGALALRCGGSGLLAILLVVARRGMVLVVVWGAGGGAAAFEIAARERARLWFCDLGVLNCVRLGLLQLRAGAGCEDDGTAKVRRCADDFGTR